MPALFRPLWKHSLSGTGIYLLILALTLAISITTALKFSQQQIEQAVALQAAEMLAADLSISNNQPIDAKWKKLAEQQQLQTSHATIFSSMARTDAEFVMVNVKAIADNFPLRGELKIQPAHARLKSGEVWLSERAMALLKVKLGEQIYIADGAFRVAGQIVYDANQETGFGGFSPTVIISEQDLAKTNALQLGSRIDYRLLLAGEPTAIKNFSAGFKTIQPKDAETAPRLREAIDGNTRLMKPMQNLSSFLQLTNILTILLCGLAIALTAQRYMQQNQNHIALLRCLGASQRQILTAYLALLAVVTALALLFGSLFGVVFGYALLQLMLQLIPHLQLQLSISAILFGPLPLAFFTSVVVMLGFVMPRLWQLCQSAPLGVLRPSASADLRQVWVVAFGALSLMSFTLILTEDLRLSLILLLVITLLLGLMYGLVAALLYVLRQRQGRLLPRQATLQITALALGLSLMSVLMVLRSDLLQGWQEQLPEQTPNQFVYGLPVFERDAFQQQLTANAWPSTPLYPNVKGRLIAKNDQAFSSELIKSNNSLRRELNLTQSNQYPTDNAIVQGDVDFAKPNQVSVEIKTAQALGIQVGDQLSFSLPEGEIKAQVINLRQVQWESFSPNFFFIFSPNSMDENAGSYLGSFYVPKAQQSTLVNVIKNFPNTVFIDIGLILDEIKKLVAVFAQIMTLLASLVLLAGILVLLACLNLLLDERQREVALLRAFGSSKAQIKRLLMRELAVIGLLAGLVACVLAEVISAVVSYRMDLSLQLHLYLWLILPPSMMLLCALIGRYRLSHLCDVPVLHSLRNLKD